MMDRLRLFLLTSGFLGYLRPAPGTWGSMPTPGIVWLLALAGAELGWINGALVLILVLSSIICLALGNWAERHFGKKDAGQIVIDETAGQCLPLLALPAFAWDSFWWATGVCAGAFLLFRFFDILKPPPAYQLQRFRGGVGVLVDDLIAGLYAAAVMQVALRVFLAP